MRERLTQSTSGFPPRQRGGFIAPPERACERVTFPGFAARVSLEGRQSRILSLTVKRFPGFTARDPFAAGAPRARTRKPGSVPLPS